MNNVKNKVHLYSERFLKKFDVIKYELFEYTSGNKYDVIVISWHKKVLLAQTYVFSVSVPRKYNICVYTQVEKEGHFSVLAYK